MSRLEVVSVCVLIFWDNENCLFAIKTLLNLGNFFYQFWHSPRPPEEEILNLWKLGRPLALFCLWEHCLFVFSLVYKRREPFSDAATSQSTFAASGESSCSVQVFLILQTPAGACSDPGGLLLLARLPAWLGDARRGGLDDQMHRLVNLDKMYDCVQ